MGESCPREQGRLSRSAKRKGPWAVGQQVWAQGSEEKEAELNSCSFSHPASSYHRVGGGEGSRSR